MILDLLPLVLVEFTRLVQNVGMDGHFADVVEESRPTKSVAIGLGQFHFIGDEVRVHANPFAVTACLADVHIEGSGENQDLLSSHDRRIAHSVVLCFLHPSREVPRAARPPSNGHAFRRLVGKDQRHLQQNGEGDQSSGKSVGDGQHDERCP